MIFAIDPGSTHSAFVVLDGLRVISCQKLANEDLLHVVQMQAPWNCATIPPVLAVEMIASYGMPVGAEVFETCVLIGRIWQAYGREPVRVKRIEVKTHLCHSARANDANIRQALIDRFGGKDAAIGRKAGPGPLYGISGDMWAALAVAVTVSDRMASRSEQVAA